MPMPVSLTDDFDVRVDALEPDLDPAAAVRELDRVRQQVPQHLLQALRDRRRRAPACGSSTVSMRTPFASAAGAMPSTALRDDVGKIHGLDVQPNLAGDDPRDVEHVLDDLRQRRRVPLDRLDRPSAFLSGRDDARSAACARSRGSR